MVDMGLLLDAQRAFERRFPGPTPRFFQAPGRVNLIGEHTDYNDGFVLPVAIDRHVVLAARARSDRLVRLWSVDFVQGSQFSLRDIAADSVAPWSNYIRGVAWALRQRGLQPCGMDAVIAGNVPIGSGLSSSAAIEVATATAFRALSGLGLDGLELARLCQRAENEFVGIKCGIMDQFISALGKRDQTLLVDCRSLKYEAVPIPAGIAIVVCDTMKRRGLVDSEYNARRRECEQGVATLSQYLPHIRALRDVTSQDLTRYEAYLSPLVYRRCRHVVTENERTQRAVSCLHAGQLTEFGELMEQSHASLRDDYQVSCPELDAMVEVAHGLAGCLGARMTGAGFGGCTVNLVQSESAATFAVEVARRYAVRMHVTPEIYVCRASAGAGELP